MSTLRKLSALVAGMVCSLAASPTHALLSLNVTHDDTLLPGYVVNTFTLDSDEDISSAVAYSELTAGSMYDSDGSYRQSYFSTPGDSYISINNDPNFTGGLGYGDLTGGATAAFFDENGIGMTWFNICATDMGTDLHLMTLTFSIDTLGSLQFLTLPGYNGRIEATFDITDGVADFADLYIRESDPEPEHNSYPGTDPDPGTTPPPPNPNPIPYPNPGGGSHAIPEPAGLGVLGAIVAIVGGLHRKRLC